VVSAVGVYFGFDGLHEQLEFVPHLRPEFLLEVAAARAQLGQTVFVVVAHTHFVVVLVLALLRIFHLNGVVAQVDQRVVQFVVVQRLLSAVRADLTVFEEVRFHVPVQGANRSIYPDVILPAANQVGMLYLLLHNPTVVLV